MSIDIDPKKLAEDVFHKGPWNKTAQDRGLETLPVYKGEATIPVKVFAAPFKLVFKRPGDQSIVWLEVETLDQLNGIASKVAGGVLLPVNEMGTLDRQLWGHLAEHVGFLRLSGGSQFAGGVAPLGPEKAELAEDMAELFGGVDPGLAALSNMRARLIQEQEARMPCEPTTTHDFVRSDGVNLTPEGEARLAEMVGESTKPVPQIEIKLPDSESDSESESSASE